MVQEPLSKRVAMRISSRSKVTWNGFTFATCEWSTSESTFKVKGISSNLTTTIAHEFNDSRFFAWNIWKLKPKVWGISSKLASTIVCEFGDSIFSSLSFASLRKGTSIIWKSRQIEIVKVQTCTYHKSQWDWKIHNEIGRKKQKRIFGLLTKDVEQFLHKLME